MSSNITNHAIFPNSNTTSHIQYSVVQTCHLKAKHTVLHSSHQGRTNISERFFRQSRKYNDQMFTLSSLKLHSFNTQNLER